MFPPTSPVYEGATLLFAMMPGVTLPYEYTGVGDEVTAAKTSAWIGTQLMTSPIYDVKGPDAVKFLNSICVNDFTNLKDKGIRHAIICNDKGQILTDGVVIKMAENTYRTYWLNPPIDYFLKKSGMDVEGEVKTGQEYFIQVSGEKSLEILENAFETDLHDIKFATHRLVKYGDKEIRVLRLGMSGNLAYEIHGPIADFEEIYRRVWAVSQAYGAKKLGMHAYSGPNHTEGGFPNILIHYPMPWFDSDPGLTQYMREHMELSFFNYNIRLLGSVGDDLQSRFVTPFDVGWGSLVNFNHEFTGKKALEEIAKNPPRTVVTLEWNADDVGEIFASQFKGKDVEPYERIDMPVDMYYQDNAANFPQMGYIYRADKVIADGKWIGNSTGRTRSYYYNTMISLAFIDPQYAVEGKELTVIWGTPGKPQKEVRVKVARYPYNDLVLNQERNVADIPRYQETPGN